MQLGAYKTNPVYKVLNGIVDHIEAVETRKFGPIQ